MCCMHGHIKHTTTTRKHRATVIVWPMRAIDAVRAANARRDTRREDVCGDGGMLAAPHIRTGRVGGVGEADAECALLIGEQDSSGFEAEDARHLLDDSGEDGIKRDIRDQFRAEARKRF